MSRATQITQRSTIDPRSPSLPAAEGRLDDRLLIICVLSLSTGLIHAAAALEHLHEYALYALFFAVLAPLQLGWGIAVYKRATPTRVSTGAFASLLIAALWIISRTTGLPIGPHPWNPESVGAVDTIATANEITIALLARAWSRSEHGHHPRPTLSRVTAAAGVCLVALSSLALTSTGHGS